VLPCQVWQDRALAPVRRACWNLANWLLSRREFNRLCCMRNSKQNRRLGITCFMLSIFVFGFSAWFEAQGSAYKHETAAINLMNRTHQRIYDWMCPPSSFFVLCKDLAGRCFSLGIVAGSLGLVFLQRGRMIQRIDILEKEIQAMRTLMPR